MWKILLALTLFLSVLAQKEGLVTRKVIKKEEILLKDKEESEMQLQIEGVNNTEESLSRQMILIEIWSYPKNPKEVVIDSVIDVYAKMNAPGHPKEFIDIKDTFPIVEEDKSIKVIYHYIIYDLCYLKSELAAPAVIDLKFKSLKGEIKSKIDAKIVEFKSLKINCVDPDGDWFLPREDHASCQTWDQKIWVFGGRRNIDKGIIPMDDAMYFDSLMNKWTKANVNNNLKPKPRYGHVMFCYFNYLIVFGGISHDLELLGDLWVYDIIKEQWNSIINSKNLQELQTSKVTGVIPKERAFGTGVMMQLYNSAYLAGGINNDGFACDLWELEIGKIIQHIEDPQTFKLDNFWSK